MLAVCQRSESRLRQIADHFGVERRYTRYEDVLADADVDFVHINSPIPDHAPMSIAALNAGKHVLSTVPMATSLEECWQIVELVEKTGLKYMMAETVVYSREFLFLQETLPQGRLGKDSIPGRVASSRHGRLAGILGTDGAHALRHARGESLPRADRRPGGVRELPGVGHDSRGVAAEVGQSLRRGVVPYQAQGFRRGVSYLASSSRHGPAVPRELRRLRHETEFRVDAGCRGRARVAHGEKARAGDSARSPCPTSPDGFPGRSVAFRKRFKTPSIAHSSKAGDTAVRIRIWYTSSSVRVLEDREPSPNAVTAAIGRAWASAPTNPPCGAVKLCICRNGLGRRHRACKRISC